MSEDVAELVFKAFEIAYDSREREKQQDSLAISLISDCALKCYYTYTLNLPPDSTSKALAMMGTLIHELIQEQLIRYGYEAEKPVTIKISDNLRLSGHVDLANDNVAIELKTVSRVPEKPYPKHVEQLNLYLHALGYSHGYLIYISRANARIKSFRIDYSESLAKHSIEKAKVIAKAIELEDPSVIPPNFANTDLCFFCEYRAICELKSR